MRVIALGVCNGSDKPMIMGNLHAQDFQTIWNSPEAEYVRRMVKDCDKQCWMIGSAAPAMKKRITLPLKWILKNKLKVHIKGCSFHLDHI